MGPVALVSLLPATSDEIVYNAICITDVDAPVFRAFIFSPNWNLYVCLLPFSEICVHLIKTVNFSRAHLQLQRDLHHRRLLGLCRDPFWSLCELPSASMLALLLQANVVVLDSLLHTAITLMGILYYGLLLKDRSCVWNVNYMFLVCLDVLPNGQKLFVSDLPFEVLLAYFKIHATNWTFCNSDSNQ